jgi:ABC-2 type transport system permease protein
MTQPNQPDQLADEQPADASQLTHPNQLGQLMKLTLVEAKILMREPIALFWGLLFPGLLLFLLGRFFPGFQDPIPELDGLRTIDLYAPIVLGLSLATVGVATLPAILATYRQFGILRRLRTTPVHPARLLLAQLIVQLAVAVVAAAAAIGVGAIAFGIPLPQNVPGFVLSFALAACSVFAIGLLIGAVAPTVSAAQGIGMMVYFPFLFFAGVYFPRDAMPEGLRTVSDLTPIGAGVQALQDTWAGSAPAVSSLIVMAAYALIAGLAAARFFRWE